jgi:transposase InsO family protein
VHAEVEATSRKKPRRLRSDRGGEFISIDFNGHCATTEVWRQLTAPYSLQQNGMVECQNQTVVATIHNMMKAKNLPGFF